jgi:hypothetical protein
MPLMPRLRGPPSEPSSECNSGSVQKSPTRHGLHTTNDFSDSCRVGMVTGNHEERTQVDRDAYSQRRTGVHDR